MIRFAQDIKRVIVNDEVLLVDHLGIIVRLNATAATTLDRLLAGEERLSIVAALMGETGRQGPEVEKAAGALIDGLIERGYLDDQPL